jgi:hypothetical protein
MTLPLYFYKGEPELQLDIQACMQDTRQKNLTFIVYRKSLLHISQKRLSLRRLLKVNLAPA